MTIVVNAKEASNLNPYVQQREMIVSRLTILIIIYCMRISEDLNIA